jgi:hypothetical protein
MTNRRKTLQQMDRWTADMAARRKARQPLTDAVKAASIAQDYDAWVTAANEAREADGFGILPIGAKMPAKL